jgi:hypothetical protein
VRIYRDSILAATAPFAGAPCAPRRRRRRVHGGEVVAQALEHGLAQNAVAGDAAVFDFKLCWRRAGLHGSNLLASVHICELEGPIRVLNVVRRYGDFRSGNPLFRLRKVSRRDTPVSIVCKRGDPAGIIPTS